MTDMIQRAQTPPAAVPARATDNRLRPDAISFPEALAQSVSVIAPAMSGAFVTYLAAIKSGGATPLAFLLAMISCLLIGGVVSSFALRRPSAGSLYTYTVDGLGPFAGFVVGVVLYFFLSWFGIEFSTRSELIFSAVTLATLLLALVIIGKGGAHGHTIDAFRPAAAGGAIATALRRRRRDVWDGMGVAFD